MHVLNTIREVIGANLKQLRGERTQKEMAKLLGLSVRGYLRIESAEVVPQVATLLRIAKRLGIGQTRLFMDPDLVKGAVLTDEEAEVIACLRIAAPEKRAFAVEVSLVAGGRRKAPTSGP